MTSLHLTDQERAWLDAQEAKHKTILRPWSRAYPAEPGRGPAGQYCRTCRHLRRIQLAKVYSKCGLMEKHWTGGPGTDIKQRAPACKLWEAHD